MTEKALLAPSYSPVIVLVIDSGVKPWRLYAGSFMMKKLTMFVSSVDVFIYGSEPLNS